MGNVGRSGIQKLVISDLLNILNAAYHGLPRLEPVNSRFFPMISPEKIIDVGSSMTVMIMGATLMSIRMSIALNTGLLLLGTVLDINGNHVIYHKCLT